MGDKLKNKDKGAKKPRRKSLEDHGRLTVMVFKSVGRIFTFKISTGLLLFATIFFILYIMVTLFTTNEYIENRREAKRYEEKIARLKVEVEMANRDIQKYQEDIAFLNKYIEGEMDDVVVSEEIDEDPIEDQPENTAVAANPKPVDIEDLEAERKSSVISLRFKLLNTLNNDEPVGGYIFVMVSLKESENMERWVYPNCSLEDGLPDNYKKGVRFFIRRFTVIEGDYKIGKETEKALTLDILVYSKDGEVMLKKTSKL